MARPDADNIQFHLNLANDSPNAIPARLQLFRDTSFIDNPSDYYCRILYFFMDNSTIPLFILDPSNPLVITLGGSGTNSYSATLQQVSYYTGSNYFYYTQQMCDSMNTAFASCMSQLNIAETQTFRPPVIIYNNSLQGFQIVVDTNYTAYVGNAIYFNNALYSYFPAFYSIAKLVSGSLIFQILYAPTGTNHYPTGVNASLPYDSYTADYEATGNSNLVKIKGIAILSYTLPINQEYINYSTSLSSSNNFRPLLLEIPLSQNVDIGVFESIFYNNANGFPNLIDMNSNTPLSKIDIQLYLVDVNDTLIPLDLAPTNSISMKVTFIKKSIFNYDSSYLLKQISHNTSY